MALFIDNSVPSSDVHVLTLAPYLSSSGKRQLHFTHVIKLVRNITKITIFIFYTCLTGQFSYKTIVIFVSKLKLFISVVSCTVTCLETAQVRKLRCIDDTWLFEPHPCGKSNKRYPEPHKRVKRGFFRFVARIFGWNRRGPPPDRTPPRVTCPPDITTYALKGQTYAIVDWNEGDASAVDDKNGVVHVSRSSRKGPKFGYVEHLSTVTYTARDHSGNTGYCAMTIRVIVLRCTPGPNPAFRNGYYVCHPSVDFVHGTRCTYGCYYGYTIRGSRVRTCDKHGSTARWSTMLEPSCEVVTCPSLELPEDATFICTHGNEFKSACTYTCKAGYDVKPGKSSVRVCGNTGSWRGPVPQCVDSEVPKFTNCPRVLTFITQRASSMGMVSWPKITATDNSPFKVIPKQIKGITNNNFHTVNVYDIVYEIVDAAGNRAKECKFKVVVKEIKCFVQYPKPYMRVDCPDGYKHGSLCTFSCNDNYNLNGSKLATCELSQSSPKYGYWKINEQPTCNADTSCTSLAPPAFGALACDLWEFGDFCQWQCMMGYDMRRSFNHKLLVCANDGIWKSNVKAITSIPPCTKTRLGHRTLMSIHYYFAGSCVESLVQEQIKENFLTAFQQSVFADVVPKFNMSTLDVTVTCGSTERKKRETGEENLATNEDTSDEGTSIPISVEVRLTLEMNSDTRGGFTRSKLSHEGIYKTMVDDIKSDTSKLFPDLSKDARLAMTINKSNVELDCPKGTFPMYSPAQYSCIGCGEGRRYSSEADDCVDCPVGTYQPEPEATTCTTCPIGTTTLQTTTVSQNSCLDMCKMGYFSPNGVEPCSPCDKGDYSDVLGSLNCKTCDGQTTTVLEGSQSSEECYHFDISMEGAEETNVEVVQATSQVWILNDGFALTFSMMYEVQGDVITMATDNEEILKLSVADDYHIQLTISGKSYTVMVIEQSRWYQVRLNYDTTSMSVLVDGYKMISHDVDMPSTDTTVRVSIGGKQFEGSVSQVNLWKSSLTSPPLTRPSCFSAEAGDVIAWREFASAPLENSYLQIPSECDDTDECLSNPCQNGYCSDILRGYDCSCNDGFEGSDCEINIDDCLEHDCTNEATCIDGVAQYTCLCTPEFTGEYCDANFVHAGWGMWGEWGQCSSSCDEGIQTRERLCDDPVSQNGGDTCHGENNETTSCNDATCKVCTTIAAPDNGHFSCETSNDGMKTCVLSCDDNFDFDLHEPPEYKCGLLTDYVWSHITVDNPSGMMPNCMAIKQAAVISATFRESYVDMECSEDKKLQVASLLRQRSSVIPCLLDNSCYIQEIKLMGCKSESNRKKRSVNVVEFSITISSKPQPIGTYNTVVNLNIAISTLNQSATVGEFTITINGIQYHLNGSPSLSGEALCKAGSTNVEFYCVDCGPGTFYINGYCDKCGLGYYSNQTGSTFCYDCPKGKSTPGIGSLSIQDCTVDVGKPVELMYLALLMLILVPILCICIYRNFTKPASKQDVHLRSKCAPPQYSNSDYAAWKVMVAWPEKSDFDEYASYNKAGSVDDATLLEDKAVHDAILINNSVGGIIMKPGILKPTHHLSGNVGLFHVDRNDLSEDKL